MLGSGLAARGAEPPPKLAWQEVTTRRTTAADLALSVERYVTGNGLTVLLSPDPAANQVVTILSFAAGGVREPPKLSGLAHLAEHLYAAGLTPGTDYQALLEQRGALYFNASTSIDRMSFYTTVPPEELPLALWCHADRLGRLPSTFTAEGFEHHRRVVLQERQQELEDAAYGTTQMAMMARLFPESSPLHRGVIGTPASLAGATLADARAYGDRYLVPANATLVLTGRFDPAQAREWVERTLGTLPPGVRAEAPAAPRPVAQAAELKVVEARARRPRVTLAWTIPTPGDEVVESLSLGSVLLPIYSDGLVGMSVDAAFLPFEGGAVFALEVTLPHAADVTEAGMNAEVVLRMLANAPMPADLVVATLHAYDRLTLARLASPVGRAALLASIEQLGLGALRGHSPTERHWRLTPEVIFANAYQALKTPHLIIHARPTRPLEKRVRP